MSVGKLTGPKKAAILLLALGEDAAAEVLKNLEEVEIQQVGYFMTRFTDISPEEVDIVLEEFYRNSVTQEEGVNINASPDFVRNALNKAVGPDRAKELSDNLSATGEDAGLDALRFIEPVTRKILHKLKNLLCYILWKFAFSRSFNKPLTLRLHDASILLTHRFS